MIPAIKRMVIEVEHVHSTRVCVISFLQEFLSYVLELLYRDSIAKKSLKEGVILYCDRVCSAEFVSDILDQGVNFWEYIEQITQRVKNSVHYLSTRASFKSDD